MTKEDILNKSFTKLEADLKKRGIILRAVKVDGEDIWDDEQYILNRLNVTIEDNIVVTVESIG